MDEQMVGGIARLILPMIGKESNLAAISTCSGVVVLTKLFNTHINSKFTR